MYIQVNSITWDHVFGFRYLILKALYERTLQNSKIEIQTDSLSLIDYVVHHLQSPCLHVGGTAGFGYKMGKCIIKSHY